MHIYILYIYIKIPHNEAVQQVPEPLIKITKPRKCQFLPLCTKWSPTPPPIPSSALLLNAPLMTTTTYVNKPTISLSNDRFSIVIGKCR